jgi:hypothetical protein
VRPFSYQKTHFIQLRCQLNDEDGRSNLTKRVEDIKKLGAKASKQLPASAMQEANEAV